MAAKSRHSDFSYDRVGRDAFLEFDSARAALESKQKMLDEQMKMMQQSLQQQAYPMYQMQGGMTNPYAPSSGGQWSSVTTTTTTPRSRFSLCSGCGRPVEEGAYCVCRGPRRDDERNYALPTDYPTKYQVMFGPDRAECKSCGEKCGTRTLSKGQDCPRTKGRKVQKQIQNFRKLYWHRRSVKPELFTNNLVA